MINKSEAVDGGKARASIVEQDEGWRCREARAVAMLTAVAKMMFMAMSMAKTTSTAITMAMAKVTAREDQKDGCGKAGLQAVDRRTKAHTEKEKRMGPQLPSF